MFLHFVRGVVGSTKLIILTFLYFIDGIIIISVLEVYQFARDASMAEAWLMAHEPYLSGHDFGVSLVCIYLFSLFFTDL